MKRLMNLGFVALFLTSLAVSLGLAWPVVQETSKTGPAKPDEQTTAAEKDQFAPVEDMHHFMEYVCEPSYKGLKQMLATQPENRAAWKAFKNHALVLAETSALVAARVPEDSANKDQWMQISLGIYKTGTALYKSSGNYEEAKKQYGLMIDQCNQCHTVFAKGKHQLEK